MICSNLLETRPTAVNLFWALEEMKKALLSVNDDDILEKAFKKADEIFEHDIISNKKIGENGLNIIQEILKKKKSNKINILTHNVSITSIYAKKKGIDVHVFVDEIGQGTKVHNLS